MWHARAEVVGRRKERVNAGLRPVRPHRSAAESSAARRTQAEAPRRPLPGRIRISIEEVKAEFGVSKQPVMDAMRRLEATGIVQIVPQSGCRVALLLHAGDPGLLQPLRSIRR